jgi:hypothetical protein
MWSTMPPAQLDLEGPSLGLKQAECEAINYLHLVPRLIIYTLLLYMPRCGSMKGEVRPVTVH